MLESIKIMFLKKIYKTKKLKEFINTNSDNNFIILTFLVDKIECKQSVDVKNNFVFINKKAQLKHLKFANNIAFSTIFSSVPLQLANLSLNFVDYGETVYYLLSNDNRLFFVPYYKYLINSNKNLNYLFSLLFLPVIEQRFFLFKNLFNLINLINLVKNKDPIN